MQFIAKDLLTQDLAGAPKDSCATSVAERGLLAAALAAESLRASGRLRLRVSGESMLPTLWPGDVVEIAGCSPDDARPGEIVLAQRDGRFFLHRLVDRSQPGAFRLRGDSMPAADPEFSNGAFFGRLASSSRQLGLWSWVIGRVFCHCAPARRCALKLHSYRLRRREVQPDESVFVPPGPYQAHARGQECPRYTLPELPSAGA